MGMSSPQPCRKRINLIRILTPLFFGVEGARMGRGVQKSPDTPSPVSGTPSLPCTTLPESEPMCNRTSTAYPEVALYCYESICIQSDTNKQALDVT